jgi:hypothetical protein
MKNSNFLKKGFAPDSPLGGWFGSGQVGLVGRLVSLWLLLKQRFEELTF